MTRTGGRQRGSGRAGSEEAGDLFVRALARGLSILTLFDVEHPEWGLNAITDRTGMSKTTVYRMLRTLEARGFLVYDTKTERYHLGGAMFPAAYLAMSYVGFVRAAHPFLEQLGKTTGEMVELTVGSAEGAVVVDEVPTTNPFRLNRPTGRILSSLGNSSFRLHVAYRPLSEQRRIAETFQNQLTPSTLADLEEVMRRLAAEREAGLAYDIEEEDQGVCAVSAPIFERDRSLKAVVTIVAPAERFGPRARRAKVEALKSTAAELTKYLAGRTSGS
ncbi:MAG: IclR family transcriptional regulator [Thermoleophilia bacterium]|nr:IclR family transcriptional regulator [Thermoleophilia bacterium]